ncbi:hypothetical protein K0M31_018228 [Melipona bicolor]|uniref:Uncharacterized protein n=1 Tax=Melipona bicolor TaxID=60889 RepID=A0AA40FCS1_9HYME|nr:hypothetical protein K0M31_018228 [Melipona bicolor]
MNRHRYCISSSIRYVPFSSLYTVESVFFFLYTEMKLRAHTFSPNDVFAPRVFELCMKDFCHFFLFCVKESLVSEIVSRRWKTKRERERSLLTTNGGKSQSYTNRRRAFVIYSHRCIVINKKHTKVQYYAYVQTRTKKEKTKRKKGQLLTKYARSEQRYERRRERSSFWLLLLIVVVRK